MTFAFSSLLEQGAVLRTVVIVVALAILVVPAQARSGNESGIKGLAEIDSVLAVYEHGWLMGGGVEVADAEGYTLQICMGFRPEHEHWGFRVGALHPADEGSEVIELGSPDESILVGLIQGYLDKKYTYSEQQRLLVRGGLRSLAESGQYDAYLAGMLSGFRQLKDMSRWLHARYSPEELDTLSRTPFERLASDADREAAGWLKALRWGLWIQDSELLQHEFLRDYELKLCGREPLAVESIGSYYDGGTVGAAVTDSNGCLVEFCIDHGLSSTTSGALYVGDRFPTSPNSRVASLAEEDRVRELVVQVLESTCFGKEFPNALQQAIANRSDGATGARLIQRLLEILRGC